jgi:hypothetical protein
MSSKNGSEKWHPLKAEYSKRALDDLRTIGKVYGTDQVNRITAAFERFAGEGRADVRPFRRIEKGLELRVGRFRAILQIESDNIDMGPVGIKKSRKI